MKYSDIRSGTQRRTKRARNERGLYFLNELVRSDIYYDVVKTFGDYFEEEIEIIMIDGVTEYTLPTDYYATRVVTDAGGNIILRGKNTPANVDPKNKVQIYGGELRVNEGRNFNKLLVKYYKPIPDFDLTTDIALPDEITAELRNIWVTGFEFYYFSENKKTRSTGTAFARYNDAKRRALTYSVGSLV